MPYTMFYDRFPDLAARETRTLIVLDDPDLPPDTYALTELYCDEPGCDCRRVMFNIFADRRKEFVAVIAYGWESPEYYREWAGENAPDLVKELKGPILNLLSPQSELAPALLKKVKEVVLQDPLYIERLKEHYQLFRKTVDGKHYTAMPEMASKKVGRNDPCPCGSGRKYKHCCSLDPAKNEKILRAAAQVRTYDELLDLVQKPVKIYRLRVTLNSMWSQPPAGTVSRTIEIEEGDSLYDLHLEIQNAFGWDNDHLYSFYMSNKKGDTQSEYAGDPMGEDLESAFGEPPGSAAQTELRALKLRRGKKFKYLFDYGDNLLHTIEVLDIHDRTDENVGYPRVVEKTGEPPPQYGYVEE